MNPSTRPKMAYCSPQCSRVGRGVPNRPGGLRRKVFLRDNGICSRCGLDCKPLGQRLKVLRARVSEMWAKSRAFDSQDSDYAILIGASSWDDFPWHADHIIPVAEGGTHDLSNLRTLCIHCHHDITAPKYRSKLAGRAAVSQSRPSEAAR